MIIKRFFSKKFILNLNEIKLNSIKYDSVKLYNYLNIKDICKDIINNNQYNSSNKNLLYQFVSIVVNSELNKKYFKYFNNYNNYFKFIKYMAILYIIYLYWKLNNYLKKYEIFNSIIKSKNAKSPQKNINTKFKDIIGIDEYKEDLEFIIEYLKNPNKISKTGVEIPKGVILHGPPGCGKTMLARAVAGESNVNFYYLCASELYNEYVGMGAELLRNTFNDAKKNGPSIIFIDEIDALTNRYQKSISKDVNSLNQLLTLMDGFELNDKVILIGATNDIKNIDKALLRPGRLDIKIEIPLPFIESRKKLLEHFSNKIKSEKIDLDEFSKKTISFSPADIKNMVNLAIINALKNNKTTANKDDYQFALERIKLGILQSNKNLNLEKVERLSLIEASKAIFLHKNKELKNEKTEKISLLHNLNNKSYLTKNDEKYSLSKASYKEKIKYYLVARVIENMNKLDISSLSNQDYKKVNEMLKDYILKFGMMEDFLLLSTDVYEISKKLNNDIERTMKNLINNWSLEIEKELSPYKCEISKFKNIIIKKEILSNKEIEDFLKNNI